MPSTCPGHNLLSASEVVFLNVPLTDETHHMISTHELRISHPGAVPIKFGSGGSGRYGSVGRVTRFRSSLRLRVRGHRRRTRIT
ncbi:NAD(P)-dependent oxidoreductase [Rhodococcus sovatensis]|uniref:NAD(P)-dependent oxidoreductase n=1 Tax=Rhodococcus sovatensis TaxID=1805840 RepID=UPI003BB1164E